MPRTKNLEEPDPEEFLLRLELAQWKYDNQLFPPERMQMIKDFLDMFKIEPTVH